MTCGRSRGSRDGRRRCPRPRLLDGDAARLAPAGERAQGSGPAASITFRLRVAHHSRDGLSERGSGRDLIEPGGCTRPISGSGWLEIARSSGGLGLITGLSHKSDKVTVTWVKQPKGFVPKEFLEVPDVPAPRAFAHEPYFGAAILSPVRRGEEFMQGPAPQSQAERAVATRAIETPVVAPLAEGKSVVEKLRDLAALRDDGIISSEEFEAKKAELLAAF